MVAAGFGALGWWDGANWVQVEPATALPVAGGEDYQVALIGLEAIVVGGPPTTLCEPVNNPGVVLENEQILGDFPGPFGVAISAPWVLVPYLVQAIEDDGTYSGFVSELLAERGLDVPEPTMKQILQVDLEGDGVNEVLVVAEDVSEVCSPRTATTRSSSYGEQCRVKCKPTCLASPSSSLPTARLWSRSRSARSPTSMAMRRWK